MRKAGDSIYKIGGAAVLAVTALILIAAIGGYITEPLSSAAGHLQTSVLAYLAVFVPGVTAILFLLYTGLKKLPLKMTSVYGLPFVLLLTLVVRAVWVLLSANTPISDFARYYNLAEIYAESGFQNIDWARYTSVFPHTWGYTLFLSFFFALFGASETLAVILNLLLCLAAAALLYDAVRRMAGREAACRAGLLWAVFPSQIFFSGLICSEMLHLTLLLLALDLWALSLRAEKKSVAVCALAGGTVALSSVVRPLGPILLTAFLLYLLIFHTALSLKRRTALCAVIAAGYFAISLGYQYLYLTPALERSPVLAAYPSAKPAMGGAGWNLFEGMNVPSGGGWNAEDNALFYQVMQDKSLTAAQVQDYFLNLAKQRAKDNLTGGQMPLLLARKFVHMWSSDDWIANWLAKEEVAAPAPLPADRWLPALVWICNAYYLAVAALCLPALWNHYRRFQDGESLPVLAVALLIIGLMLLHLLVETNGRYHYPLNALLCVLASGVFTDPPFAEMLKLGLDKGRRRVYYHEQLNNETYDKGAIP